MKILETITALSHEFGTTDYVKGGGGNTSCKDADTLWVKPSGTTLGALKPETFVALDREKIDVLYATETPQDKQAREALVKEVMENALKAGSTGRASVEAPLHNVFSATYVVHTHPALVNGMTCAQNGKAACARLFPDALWMDYVDAGYTLCMKAREEIKAFEERIGREPNIIFLKNHGVFVAGNSVEEIREAYALVMDTLRAEYKRAGISTELFVTEKGDTTDVEAELSEWIGADATAIKSSGTFEVAAGPITPDHIVYSKSYPLIGGLNREAIESFKANKGYFPRVIVAFDAVFAVGASEKVAELALILAQDGALVQQLAEAFGGIEFMTDDAREFIENWEVEAYRAKQMS